MMIAIKDVKAEIVKEYGGVFVRVGLYTGGEYVKTVMMPNFTEGFPAVLVWGDRTFGWARDVERYEEVFAVTILRSVEDTE